MSITYELGNYQSGDKTVEVTFTNEEGLIHKRMVNIPYENGSIDRNYFQEILEGQLRGVENKLKVGAISFIDPTNTEEFTLEN